PSLCGINARRSAASRDYRWGAAAQLNIAYGAGARQRYDLFGTGSEPAPLIVYIHGGYWQRGDREDYAFLARELNAAGIPVALPSYSLFPAVTVMDIVRELRAFLAHLRPRRASFPGAPLAARQGLPAVLRPLRRGAFARRHAGHRLARDRWCAGRSGAGGLCGERRLRPAAAGRHQPQCGAQTERRRGA